MSAACIGAAGYVFAVSRNSESAVGASFRRTLQRMQIDMMMIAAGVQPRDFHRNSAAEKLAVEQLPPSLRRAA
jgi:hypothetical protein